MFRVKPSLRLAILLTLALLLLAGTASGQETIRRAFDVDEGGILTIRSDVGSIEVRSNNAKKVDVEIIVDDRGRARDMEELMENMTVDFDQSGNNVTVNVELRRKSWGGWWRSDRNPRLKFLISVPSRYNLDLRTSGGSIEIDNVQGDVRAETSGGSLRFGDVKGPVYGKTSGGSVTVGRTEGNVEVYTSGGSIRIERAKGNVIAKTSGGSVTVDEVDGYIDAKTSGGSMSAYLTQQPKANCSMRTSGGNITVYLGGKFGLDIDASTSGGRVRTDFPITVSGEISQRSLHGAIHGGGPELYLRTSGGSIHIRER